MALPALSPPMVAVLKITKTKIGSEQEFDRTRILGCFLEDHEFGPSGRHARGLQEQVA
jgi:hypothetical protein